MLCSSKCDISVAALVDLDLEFNRSLGAIVGLLTLTSSATTGAAQGMSMASQNSIKHDVI